MDVTFYDTVTNKPVLYCDSLKMTNIENKAEQTFARGGKGNPKLIGWDFNREATMKISDALMSPKSIALLSGKAPTIGSSTVLYRRDEGKVVTIPDSAEITNSPVIKLAFASTAVTAGTSTFTIGGHTENVTFIDNETATNAAYKVFKAFEGKLPAYIIGWDGAANIYVSKADGINLTTAVATSTSTDPVLTVTIVKNSAAQSYLALPTTRLPVSGATRSGFLQTQSDDGTELVMDSADPTMCLAKITSGCVAGDSVAVYYTFNSFASNTVVMQIDSSYFPGTYRIVGDTVIRNAFTQKDESFQVIINKAKIAAGFTMTFQADGDPSVFDMDVEVLRDPSGNMVTMVKY